MDKASLQCRGLCLTVANRYLTIQIKRQNGKNTQNCNMILTAWVQEMLFQFVVVVKHSHSTGYCLEKQQSANFSPRRSPLLSPAAKALRYLLQQCLYRPPSGPAPSAPASQSKREARHLRCILPGNMPAEEEDKQEGGGLKGGMVGPMNRRPKCHGNVQGLAWACYDHTVFV